MDLGLLEDFKMGKNWNKGFIVHPNWTNDEKYHASYGRDNNKTVKSFDTLKQAKAYVKKHNYDTALYKGASADAKIIKTKVSRRKQKKKFGFCFGGL